MNRTLTSAESTEPANDVTPLPPLPTLSPLHHAAQFLSLEKIPLVTCLGLTLRRERLRRATDSVGRTTRAVDGEAHRLADVLAIEGALVGRREAHPMSTNPPLKLDGARSRAATRLPLLPSRVGTLPAASIRDVQPAASTSAAAGANIHWDATNSRTTISATSNLKIGVAAVVSTNTATTVRVRLNGSF